MNQRPRRNAYQPQNETYRPQNEKSEKQILQEKLAAIEANEQETKIAIRGQQPQNPRQTKASTNALFALAKKSEQPGQQLPPTNIHSQEIPQQYLHQKIEENSNEDIEVDEVAASQHEAKILQQTAENPEDLFPGEYFLSIRGDVTSSMDKLQIIRLIEQFLSAADSPYKNLSLDEICVLQRLDIKYGLTIE